MKRVIFYTALCLILVCSATAEAQVKVGVRAGLNLTSLSIMKNDGIYADGIYAIDNNTGFFAGPVVQVGLPVNLSVEGGLLYSRQQAKVECPYLVPGPIFQSTLTHQQIAIPISLRYNLPIVKGVKAFAYGGPQLSFHLGSREKEMDYGDWLAEKTEFSMNVGLGVNLFSHFEVAVGYHAVCGKSSEIWINREWSYGECIYKGRFNAWQLSLAYYL